jgi:hypothetical protein
MWRAHPRDIASDACERAGNTTELILWRDGSPRKIAGDTRLDPEFWHAVTEALIAESVSPF